MKTADWKKTGVDLFAIQGKWTLWFLPIVFAVYTGLNIFSPAEELGEISFLTFVRTPANIFMLICGIIIVFAFLTHFVKYGVTRKNYFIGTVISAAGLSLTIMTVSMILTGGSVALQQVIPLYTQVTPEPFLNTGSQWILPALASFLSMLLYYMAGWGIAIGFYRYGGWGGAFAIISAVFLMAISDILWAREFPIPLPGVPAVDFSIVPVPFLFLILMMIISGTIWLLYLITRTTPIKVE
ncbi:hypothetical protein [Alteribacter natronophilus]|uniref:hypothetical protein n=1 Tax=Alteribacter natronophilus TaxID=2583810 RepID=UPI00110D32C1|nr:hypothetical protein [Alteribacter natronophilus]TMW71437.1 hypothetical protein FGB90_10330 [Alteribacter natronophilus]